MHKPESSSPPKKCYILQRRNYEGHSDEGQLEIIACYDRFENAQKHGEVVVRQIYSAWNRARKLPHRRQRIRKNGAMGLGGNGLGNGANGNGNGNGNGMEVVYCLDGGDGDDVLCRVVVSITEMRVLGGFGDRESEEEERDGNENGNGNVIGYLNVEEFEEGAASERESERESGKERERERDDGVVDGDDVRERGESGGGGCTVMACWCDEAVARRERMRQQSQPTTQPGPRPPHPPQQDTPLDNNVRRSTDSTTGDDANTTSNPLASTPRTTDAQSVTVNSTQQPMVSQTRIVRPGASNFLAGKTFSITRLPPIDRDQIMSMITQYGGSLVSWMDQPRRSTVDFLITMTDCPEKLKKRAKEHNVTQLTPEGFFNMISTSLASESKVAASGSLGSKRGIEEVDSCDDEGPESKKQRKIKTKTRLEKEASEEYRFRCAFPGCKSIYNRRDNLTQHIKKKGHYVGGGSSSGGGGELDENGTNHANGTNGGGASLRNESEVQDSIVVIPRSMTSVFLASQNVNTASIPNRVRSSLALKDGYSENHGTGTVRTIRA